MAVHIILFGCLLPVVDILKSGGSLIDALGCKSQNSSNKHAEPSNLEDDDVKQERIEAQNYLNGSFRSKVFIL